MSMTLQGGRMPNLFLGESSDTGLVKAFSAIEGIEIAGVGRTGREVAEAIKDPGIDAFAFPAEWAELSRSIRISRGLSLGEPPAFVLVATDATPPLVLKSHLYGFDGVISTSMPAERLDAKVRGILDGPDHVSNDPVVRAVGIAHGLLARVPVIGGGDDRDVADLVGAGLTDPEISDILGIDIQRVRNSVERLIAANGLKYRTQLAVLVTSLVDVPDFS